MAAGISGAVNQIVDALGQLEEEGLVGADHRPPGVEAELVQDRDQLRQHLGHAAALGGRVHHPQPAAPQPSYQGSGLLAQLADGGGQVHDLGVGIQSQRLVNFYVLDHRPSPCA